MTTEDPTPALDLQGAIDDVAEARAALADDAPELPFEGDDAVVGEHLDEGMQKLAMLNVPLEGVPLAVLKAESGDRMLTIGPVAFVFQVPIGAEHADQVADALRSSAIKVATVGDMQTALAAGIVRKRLRGHGG